MAESVEKYFSKLKEKERIRKQSHRNRLASKNNIGRRTGQKISIGRIEDVSDLFLSFDSDSSISKASNERTTFVSAQKSAKTKHLPLPPNYEERDNDSESNDDVAALSRTLPNRSAKIDAESDVSDQKRTHGESTALERISSKSYVDQATQCTTPSTAKEEAEQLAHTTFREMATQMSSGIAKRATVQKTSARKLEATEKSQSHEIFQKILSSRKGNGKNSKPVSENAEQVLTSSKNSPDPQFIKTPKEVVEAYNQMISSQKSHLHHRSGGSSGSFKGKSPSLTPRQKPPSSLRRKLSFVGNDNNQNLFARKPQVTLDPLHVSAIHPVFELDKASSVGLNDVVDVNQPTSTVWLFASPNGTKSSVRKWRSSSLSRSSSKALNRSAKQPQKDVTAHSGGNSSSRRRRRSKQMLDFSSGNKNLDTENEEKLTMSTRTRSNAKKKLSYSKKESLQKRSSKRLSVLAKNTKSNIPGTLVEYSSSDEENVHKKTVNRLPLSVKQSENKIERKSGVDQESRERRSTRRSKHFLESLAEDDIQIPDDYFKDSWQSSGQFSPSDKKQYNRAGSTREHSTSASRTEGDNTKHKILLIRDGKKRTSGLIKVSSDGVSNESQNLSHRYRSRYYSDSSGDGSECDQVASSVNKKKKLENHAPGSELDKRPSHEPESAISSRTTSRKKKHLKQSVRSNNSHVPPPSLAAWLDSVDQFHERESPICLSHSKVNSPNIKKSAVVNQKSPGTFGSDAHPHSKDDDHQLSHPPLPKVDESNIYGPINTTSGTRLRSPMGPPASTPRARKTVPLTQKNLSNLSNVLAQNEIVYQPADHYDEAENDEDGAGFDIIHSSSHDSHDDYSRDSYSLKKKDRTVEEDLLVDEKRSRRTGRSLHHGTKRKSSASASTRQKVARNTSSTSRGKRMKSRVGVSVAQTRKIRGKDKRNATNKNSDVAPVMSANEETLTKGKYPKKNRTRAKAKGGMKILLRHEQKMSIVVPKDSSENEGPRRSKRVRTRPMGFGERLIYDENSYENGFRKIIGVQRNHEIINLDIEKTRGDVIHLPGQETGILDWKKERKMAKNRGWRKTGAKKHRTKVSNTLDNKKAPKMKLQDVSRHREEAADVEHRSVSSGSESSSQEFHSKTWNVSKNMSLQVRDYSTASRITVGISSLICNEQGAFGHPIAPLFDKDGISVSKGLSLKLIGMEGLGTAHGMVKIQPLCKKVERVVNNASMSFFVFKGTVELTLEGNTLTLPHHTYFQIPCKNRYSLLNPSKNKTAELFFTLYKLPKPGTSRGVQ